MPEVRHADTHVIPIRDLREHDEARTCWCEPEIWFLCAICTGKGCRGCAHSGFTSRPNQLGVVVVHEALDGRE